MVESCCFRSIEEASAASDMARRYVMAGVVNTKASIWHTERHVEESDWIRQSRSVIAEMSRISLGDLRRVLDIDKRDDRTHRPGDTTIN